MVEISVGICAHNEEDTIGELLEQVAEEDIPVKQVIVVAAGDDRTAEIAARKSLENPEMEVVREEEREGQTAAQNRILERVQDEAVLFLDGDGLIDPGSLERLYDRFDGENVVAGREIPVTGDSLIGRMIDRWSEVHHRICLDHPRFSTHLGIVPGNLIDSFPDVVLDDVYIEHMAEREKRDIEYVEDAVKRHHMPDTWRFFFRQQEKNWAGRFQAEREGFIHRKPEGLLAGAYFAGFPYLEPRKLPSYLALGMLEIAAYITAKRRVLSGDFPVKWWRPGSGESADEG